VPGESHGTAAAEVWGQGLVPDDASSSPAAQYRIITMVIKLVLFVPVPMQLE
jgi:hypothetical protein